MKRDAMDALKDFYAGLEATPVPHSRAVPNETTRLWRVTPVFAAPVVAAALAYAFLMFCASSPASSPSPIPAGVYEAQMKMAGLDLKQAPALGHHSTLGIARKRAA